MYIPMIKNPYPGKLLVFEGVDGAGKTTVLTEAQSYLRERGIATYTTKMPSNRVRQMDVFRGYLDSHDDAIRRQISVFALTTLISGDRLIVLEAEVIPELQKGTWVLCDRYVYSGVACCDHEVIRSIGSEFLEPDVSFLASAPPELVRERVLAREAEKDLHYDDEDVRLKMRRFHAIARANPSFVVLDTSGPFAGVRGEIHFAVDALGLTETSQAPSLSGAI